MKLRVGHLRKLIREALAVAARVEDAGAAGRGVFSLDYIPRGGLVFRWRPGVDASFPPSYPESLPPAAARRFRELASWDGSGWFLAGDGGAFFNHSSSPNVGVLPGHGPRATWDRVALRDVFPGEELTMDYSSIGLDF